MRLIRFLWSSSKLASSIAFALSVIGGLSSAAMLVVIQAAIRVRTPRLILEFAGLCLVLCACRVSSQILLVHLAQRCMLDLVMELSRSFLRTPLQTVERLGHHRVTAALTDDVATVTFGLTALPAAALAVTMICGSFIYLGWLSLATLATALLFVAAGVMGFRLAYRAGDRFFVLARLDRDEMFDGFRSLIGGLKELKLNRLRKQEFLKIALQERGESFRRHNLNATSIHSVFGAGALLLFYTLIGLLLFWLPNLLHLNREVVTGYIFFLLFLISPIDALTNLLPTIGRAAFALTQLDELGLTLSQSAVESDRDDRPAFEAGPLELREVMHRYEPTDGDEPFVTGPISLTIRPGEALFLLGGNGSGKTTLAKVITGLYLPCSGHIRVDGVPVTTTMLDAYRNQFSAVFSDFHLFRTFYGIEASTVEKSASAYIDELRLSHKVRVTGRTLSTTDLSQGQRKRLALLAALLEDRPVYVLDEWAADQDVSYKQFFYEEMIPALKRRGKTVIVITHDERYVDSADHLIRLENGQIAFEQISELSFEESQPQVQVVGGSEG